MVKGAAGLVLQKHEDMVYLTITEGNLKILQIVLGYYFGETDMLTISKDDDGDETEKRMFTVKALKDSELLVLNKMVN